MTQIEVDSICREVCRKCNLADGCQKFVAGVRAGSKDAAPLLEQMIGTIVSKCVYEVLNSHEMLRH